jgi:hypothetical protein
MGSLGPIQVIGLLLAVSVIAAAGGYIASAVARRNKRRARLSFLLGFLSGVTAGVILRQRRGGSGRFAVRTLSRAASHARLGFSPPQWHRQLRAHSR